MFLAFTKSTWFDTSANIFYQNDFWRSMNYSLRIMRHRQLKINFAIDRRNKSGFYFKYIKLQSDIFITNYSTNHIQKMNSHSTTVFCIKTAYHFSPCVSIHHKQVDMSFNLWSHGKYYAVWWIKGVMHLTHWHISPHSSNLVPIDQIAFFRPRFNTLAAINYWTVFISFCLHLVNTNNLAIACYNLLRLGTQL